MTKLADYNNEIVRPWRELVGRAVILLGGVNPGQTPDWEKSRIEWMKDVEALVGRG
jgi:hypothetical protein